MYSTASGIPRAKETAVEWFRKAAAQGNARAQYNLGTTYASGTGIPRSPEQAFYWYRQSP